MFSAWERLSIRSRLTLWHMFSLFVILTLFTVTVFFFQKKAFYESLDKQLRDDFELAVEILKFDESGNLSIRSDKYLGDSLYRTEQRWLEVWSAGDKRILYPRTSVLGQYPDRCNESSEARPYSDEISSGETLRIYCSPVSLGVHKTFIRVGRSEAFVRYELNELLFILAAFFPAGILASATFGHLLARKSLAPVDRIVRQAERISADRLNLRISVDNETDELGRLAKVFNKTFDRLEQSFSNIKRFTADASHELRTPLTAMRAVGDVGLRSKHTAEDLRAVVASMLEEAESMSRLVDSLLFLSRTDVDQQNLYFESTPLADLIRETVNPLQQELEKKSVRLEVVCDASHTVHWDRALMVIAVRNLVQNSLKFIGAGNFISVVCTSDPRETYVQVRDNGIGIASLEIEHIFERFYRVDKVRARENGGFGLGLPLVRWIVEMHSGEITVESRPGSGSVFTLKIPTKPQTRAEKKEPV